MATLEEEFRKFKPVMNTLSDFALVGKKVVTKGRENLIQSGPNIIVGNHIGTFKDIAVLVKEISRPIFFTANKMIFSRQDFNSLTRKHLVRHLKNFGYFMDLILKPLKTPLVNYISSNISRVGTIPVDLYRKKRVAIEKCQEYVKKGRAVILLQGRGRIMSYEPNPYVSHFRKGVSIIAYNLFNEHDLSVPVTPMAIFGTHFPFLVPGKIYVNIGEPMHIDEYVGDGFAASVEKFRTALEKKVNELFLEILRAQK